jgi:hypothetical protein
MITADRASFQNPGQLHVKVFDAGGDSRSFTIEVVPEPLPVIHPTDEPLKGGGLLGGAL